MTSPGLVRPCSSKVVTAASPAFFAVSPYDLVENGIENNSIAYSIVEHSGSGGFTLRAVSESMKAPI